MHREEVKKWFECQIKNKKIQSIISILKYREKNVLQDIENHTSYLEEDCKVTERIYNILNDIFEIPNCPVCGNKVEFLDIRRGYKKYCCKKCIMNDNEIIEKRKKEFKKKYGVENPSQAKEIKEKRKQTNLKRFGSEYFFSTKEGKEKIKKTIQEKYGEDYIFKTENFKKRSKKLFLKKYGVKHQMHIPEIKERVRKTCKERFGYTTNLRIPEVVKKAKEELKKSMEDRNKINIESFKNIKYIGKVDPFKYSVKCIECNKEFELYHQYFFNKKSKEFLCPFCHPELKNASSGEISLCKWFRELLGDKVEILQNYRGLISPKEVDIFIPAFSLAIEYNGLFWHSEEMKKEKFYHLQKTLDCKDKDVQLIQIFEDEWIFFKDIVKERFKQILKSNYNKQKIYARNCEVKEIDFKDKKDFLNKFHIQHDSVSKINLGAFYKGQLISVMTFSHGNISKGESSKEYIWELNRFCSDYNYRIIGIAGKLLEYFKRNYNWKKIFSYADRRWSTGNVYKKLGFDLIKETEPNYWYVKNFQRIHRFSLRKRKDEPQQITETVLRKNQGYKRIWDCGHLKFSMENST